MKPIVVALIGEAVLLAGGRVVQLAQPCLITTSTKLLASFEDAGIISRTKEGTLICDVNRLDSVGME